jgi:hypothetical protein
MATSRERDRLRRSQRIDFAGVGFKVDSGGAVYVFTSDNQCAVHSLGSLVEGKIVGNAYVVDREDTRWRIVDGKLQQVK